PAPRGEAPGSRGNGWTQMRRMEWDGREGGSTRHGSNASARARGSTRGAAAGAAGAIARAGSAARTLGAASTAAAGAGTLTTHAQHGRAARLATGYPAKSDPTATARACA